jgi:sporulation related protein
VNSLRPGSRHLSDDEIFEILNTVGDREDAVDVFAAKGVTLPMYCLWKSKYRHLTLEEFREARRRELWRARGMLSALIVVAVLGAGGIVYGLARAVQWNSAGGAEAQSARTPSASTPPASTPVELRPSAYPSAPTTTATDPEPGYKIQVAAAPTVDEARVLVERLTTDGYAAYLFQATVSNQEVFRVRVGPFDTLPAAEETASRLHRAGYADAWITR